MRIALKKLRKTSKKSSISGTIGGPLLTSHPVTGPILFSDDPECRYYQDSDNKESADHRGQMMQFCGHDPICRKFNNPEALQKAKANVEKHYSVVGITENINMTLGEYCTYSIHSRP